MPTGPHQPLANGDEDEQAHEAEEPCEIGGEEDEGGVEEDGLCAANQPIGDDNGGEAFVVNGLPFSRMAARYIHEAALT